MNLLNRYFAPFAALLILSAVHFGEVEPKQRNLAWGVLIVSAVVNWWLSKNTYRFIGWANRLRTLQIWLTFVWTVPLFYLLHGFWGPMWLLFVMAPVTAALYGTVWSTLGMGLVSSSTMLGIYWLHGVEGEVWWGQIGTQAVFIIVMALFTFLLSQTALKLRDMSR
ncbi:MAG: hypothetical protein HY553_07970 [Elusimicrobia bacterium]|nr:hypothetical protein [Elusimicrobiota bacterium]